MLSRPRHEVRLTTPGIDSRPSRPRRRLDTGGEFSLLGAAVAGVALIVIAVLLRGHPDIQGRFAMGAIGLFILIVAVLRPPGVWDSEEVESLRWAIGDWLTFGILVLCALPFIVMAVVGKLLTW